MRTLPDCFAFLQQSCHELKKYISEGRDIIRRIEADTYAENPRLFREYMASSPDVRFIMDNQFKNIKTYARLSSKAVWYEWRRKLLDDLKQGLVKIDRGMDEDEDVLWKRQDALTTALPALSSEHERLKEEHAQLQTQAEQWAKVDQAESQAVRKTLVALEQEAEEKRLWLDALQMKIRERQEAIELATERKMGFMEEIKQAEKIKEGCRGWNMTEVKKWKGKMSSFRF